MWRQYTCMLRGRPDLRLYNSELHRYILLLMLAKRCAFDMRLCRSSHAGKIVSSAFSTRKASTSAKALCCLHYDIVLHSAGLLCSKFNQITSRKSRPCSIILSDHTVGGASRHHLFGSLLVLLTDTAGSSVGITLLLALSEAISM